MPTATSKMSSRRSCLLSLFLAGLAWSAGLGASAPAGLASAWRTQPVTVDGEPNEWPQLAPLEKGPAVGVVNDDEFAYLMVSTNEPAMRDLLAIGLVVWFDPSGGKAQTFGIWIPGPVERPLRGATPGASAQVTMSGISSEVMDQFDLLGPGKNQRRLIDLTPALALELASGVREGSLFYELKVPLKKTDARLYAVGAGPGATIGIGLTTPEAPRDRGRKGPLVGGTGTIGGTYPYMPGMGGRGFAGYREKEEQLKPLAIWTTLKLASAR